MIRKLLCCAVVALTVATVRASPVPESDRVPIDLRRTPRTAASDDAAQRSLRLVFVQANDDFIGIIGLIEYRKPVKQAPAVVPDAFSIGTNVLLFNATDLDRTFARARAVPGVSIVEEPVETTYPGYDGKPPIPVRVSTLRDPDGFTIELNQLLVDKVR